MVLETEIPDEINFSEITENSKNKMLLLGILIIIIIVHETISING